MTDEPHAKTTKGRQVDILNTTGLPQSAVSGRPSAVDFERWQKVEVVFQGALDRPPQDRDSFLDEACVGDEQLKQEATSLVNAYAAAGDFIEQPAIARDARVLFGDDSESRVGGNIGPYKIVARLGEGGMGEVYLAADARLDRLVALKILPAYFAADGARLRRFQREARAASALNHPNILTIHEIGEADGLPYISTEFIDGTTIRELVNRQELSLAEVLDIAEQVASALAAAHAAGIVHRDIKPENIMRRADGLVKILDFGIAKLVEQEDADETQLSGRTHTEAGLVLGTVNYMSPEQARGLPVDERTDLWSLGVVVYEMLARRLPFLGATRMDTIVAVLDREPSPLSEVAAEYYRVSPLLEQTIDKCLCKKATDRLRSANEMLVELRRVREGPDGPSQAGSTLKDDSRETNAQARFMARLSSRRNAWVALGLMVVLTATVAILYRRSRSAAPASAANVSEGTATAATGKLYLAMSEPEQLAFIREQEQHVSAMMGDRPGKLNEEALQAIKTHVDRYAARSQKPDGEESLNDIYGRAPRYVPLIARSFAARKVPVIIGIYLPVIESAYRPCFENAYGSKGLFQFLPQTAKIYGVPPEAMCDADQMAPAAAHYIADHMAELGDDAESMTLVLLSYNRGATWVRTTLRELRDADDYQRNFWTLFAHRAQLDETFRNEGAGYVPNFFAAAIVGENPRTFGLSSPPLSSVAASSGQ